MSGGVTGVAFVEDEVGETMGYTMVSLDVGV